MSSAEPLPQGEEFLSRRQRRNPIVLPSDPSDEELARNWTLSETDKRAALRCRGETQRRRFAVQLCTLATYGRFLRPQDEIPVRILNHVAYQLDLPAVIVADPPPKEDADYEHQQRIREHLGFRTFDAEVQAEMERWIDARALEGSVPKELFEDLKQELLRRKVVLPAPSTLERLVAAVCARAREEIFTQVPIFRTSGFHDAITLLPSGIKWRTGGRRMDHGSGRACKTGRCGEDRGQPAPVARLVGADGPRRQDRCTLPLGRAG